MTRTDEIRARLAAAFRSGAFCPDCGPCPVDADGCCNICGSTATGQALDRMITDMQYLLDEIERLRAGLEEIKLMSGFGSGVADGNVFQAAFRALNNMPFAEIGSLVPPTETS